MLKLSFDTYQFQIKNSEKGRQIFDVIRKKFVALTPEEWVRQHVIQFLIREKKAPTSWLNAEKQFSLAGLSKRFDVLLFRADGTVQLIVECKAPHIPIDQKVFDQIARYNQKFNATYMMVTNGIEHYFCPFDHHNKKYVFLPALPDLNP